MQRPLGFKNGSGILQQFLSTAVLGDRQDFLKKPVKRLMTMLPR